MNAARRGAPTTLRTDLCRRLNIRYPIVLAGMAGPAGPELAAAVSEAGGLGVLGAAGLEADELDEWIRTTRRLTGKPFGVDTVLPSSVPDEVDAEQTRRELDPVYLRAVNEIRLRHELPEPSQRGAYEVPAFTKRFFQRQLEVVMDQRVPVYAAGLGNPAPYVQEMHRRGTQVLGLVGTARQALRVLDGGADGVVAQGHEAGGHASSVGTFVLVPRVVDAMRGQIPVLAAGGVTDGRGLVAALALGASAVWVGTRFLATIEARIPDGQKRKIVEASEEDTMITRYITGKPVRTLRTPIPAEFERRGLAPLPMPQMGILAGGLWAAAEQTGRFDLSPGLAGQGAGLVSDIAPAGQVVAEIVAEAEQVLECLGEPSRS